MPSITLTRILNHICRNTPLSVQDGELLVLVGATGAGKTTILNVIAGLSQMDSGAAGLKTPLPLCYRRRSRRTSATRLEGKAWALC